jgi:NtrC-family two-component system response regulator AlgB
MTETASRIGRRVLLVEDDTSILRNFKWCLEDAGFDVLTANSVDAARQRLDQNLFDLCFLDVNIGEDSGIELLPELVAQAPWMRIVMATAESAMNSAVRALKAGAVDYLVKPCSPEDLVRAAERQAEARRLAMRIEQLESRDAGAAEADLSTAHADYAKVLEMARQVADTDASVLILGESGTGKNVLARAIHGWSGRARAAFAQVNCPSLSAELLESELFGHVKGAFTGATENRQGRVQIADGGTLFLDEIGDFPLALQPKLLRFVQEREYERVGDPHTKRADVRIIAATNRNLEAAMQDGRFREDLYYRLNVIALLMPPLRERADDIPALAQRFLVNFAKSYKRPAREFSADAMAALKRHPWPGNVRELRNVVERVAILCPADTVEASHLPPPLGSESAPTRLQVGADVTLEALERAHLEAIVAKSPSLDAAAKTLGIDSSTLYRKRKQYGMS